jgi:hypothetical protein
MEDTIVDNEYIAVVRRQNRTLRKIHKILRSALKSSKVYSDQLFLELCEHDSEARIALEKLWALGGMQEICDPLDYNKVVEVCIQKMNVTSPIDQSIISQ